MSGFDSKYPKCRLQVLRFTKAQKMKQAGPPQAQVQMQQKAQAKLPPQLLKVVKKKQQKRSCYLILLLTKGLGANMWSLKESLLHILLPSFSSVALLLPFVAPPLNNPGRKEKVKEATWKFVNVSNIPESFCFYTTLRCWAFFICHFPLH